MTEQEQIEASTYAYIGKAARKWLPQAGEDMINKTRAAILALVPVLGKFTPTNVYKLDQKLTEQTGEPKFNASLLRQTLMKERGIADAGLFLQEKLRPDQFNTVLHYFL